LHVFPRNVAARRFYEAAGFVLVDQSDGRRNEEQEPDCTYTWLLPARRTN
jgi:RimJ/RimL family protein N-acetyltransferase